MNEELKNISDMFLEVINTMKSNMSNFDYSGLKETIGDIEAMTSLLQEASGTYLSGFNKQLTGMIESLKIANVEGLSFLKQEAIKKIELEKINNIIDLFGNKFETVASKSISLIEKIPLLGNTIGSVLTTKATELKSELSDKLKSAFSDGELSLSNFKTASIATFSSIGKMISSTFTAVLANPWILAIAGVLLLARTVWKMFSQFDSAAADFRKEAGLTTNISKELEQSATNTYFTMTRYGVTLESSYKSMSALVNAFGNTNLIAKELNNTVAVMSSRFGIAEDDSTGMLKVLMNSTGATGEVANNLMFAGKYLADAAGVPFDKVVKDIANNAQFINTYFRGSGQEILKAAVNAARLGTSLSAISGSVESILDFQSSVSNQMTASALVGKSINLNYARQLAYQGRISEYQDEILRQTEMIGDFDSMDFVKKKAIAAAMGLQVDELGKMVANKKILDDMTISERKEYEAALAITEDLTKLDKDRMLMNAKQAAQTAQLGEAVNALWVTLSSNLVPVVKIISSLLEGMISVVSEINSWFGDSAKSTNEFADNVKDVNEEVKETTNLFKIIGAGLGIAAGLALLVKFGKMIFSSFNGIKNIFTGGGGILDGLSKVTKIKTPPGGGIKSFLSNVASGISKFGTGLVLKGAASMVIIAGATWVLAKAMQEFSNGVSWEGFAIGIISLAALTGAVLLLGSTAPVALIGAAALLVVSGAMWIMGNAMQQFAKAAVILIPVIETIGGVIVNFGNVAASIITSIANGISQVILAAQSADPTRILAVSAALTTLGYSFIALGTGKILDAFGNLLGGDNIFDMIGNLADKSDAIATLSNSITSLKQSLLDMSTIDMSGLDSINSFIDKLIDSYERLSDAIEDQSVFEKVTSGISTITDKILGNTSPVNLSSISTTSKSNDTSILAKKLDDVITAINSMTVTMDGRTVGKIIANAAPNAASTI